MNKKLRMFLLLLVVLCIGTISFLSYRNQQPVSELRPSTEKTSIPEPTPTPVAVSASGSTSPIVYKDLIEVTSPISSALVSSPLVITGKARGTWFFEASFPIELSDANGIVLAKGTATADANWMTTEFVPFHLNLTFPAPSTKTGFLILKNDNPSGDPAKADQLKIPVVFTP